MKKLVLTAVILMSFSSAALADIPRPSTPKPTETPKQKKSIDTMLLITLTKTKTAKLKIPKGQIAQLRAQLDELDGGGNNTAAVSGSPGFTRLQTIVSGAFLSLALVFGGLWFARSKKIDTKGARGLAIGAFLFLSGAVATVVLANAGPPDEARSITGKMFTEAVHSYKSGSGEIKLMVNEEGGDRVELVVPDPNGFPDRDEE
jgi:hypothetical protein